jgi:hypothetical protein
VAYVRSLSPSKLVARWKIFGTASSLSFLQYYDSYSRYFKTQSLHNYVCSVLKYRILALMKLCSPAVSLYCITQKETDRLAMCGLQVSSAVGHVGGRDYNSYPLIQNFGNSATMPI